MEPAGLVTSLVQHWTGYQCRGWPPKRRYAMDRRYPIAFHHFTCLPLCANPRRGVWAIFTVFSLVCSSRNGDAVHGRLLAHGYGRHHDALRQSQPSHRRLSELGIVHLVQRTPPAAGRPAVPSDGMGGGLSSMSYLGHVIYGFTAGYVFETWQKRSRRPRDFTPPRWSWPEAEVAPRPRSVC